MRRFLGLIAGSMMVLVISVDLAGSLRAQPQESRLEKKVVVEGRPRLFFRHDGLERLRMQITSTHRAKWEKLKSAADAALGQVPPAFRKPRVGGDSTRPGTLNDEMLWQRQYGYKLPGMALVALLDGSPRYFELTRRWALQPATYPLWGAGLYENTGLAAKHQLFGISIAYDWLYDRWSTEDRIALRETLRRHGRILYEAAEGINDRGWWKDTWRQNHAWNGYQALAVTAIALMGEEPDAETWLKKALWGGRHIVQELEDEGAYEEGLPYWGYGMEALVRFLEAVTPYSEEDFYSYDYFSNTYLFRLHLAGPDVGQIANFGDGRTTDWHAMETTMYRLAAQYRNPVTQWLADSMPDRTDLDASCWGLLWYDAEIQGKLPQDTPRSHVFRETGFAGARTDWTTEAMTLHLRSGVADVSHSHLDVNNFLLNVAGEWLLKDYGYGRVGPGYFNKQMIYFNTGTPGHNCLVIDGKDQRKDHDSVGKITDAVDTGEMVWWRSDATACYEGSESVVRDLVMLRPGADDLEWGAVVIRDQARTTSPASFDFLLQPGGRVALSSNGTFVIEGEKVSLAGIVIAPNEVAASVEHGIGKRINVEDPLSLRISAPEKAEQVEFQVVFIPFRNGSEVPAARLTEAGIEIGSRVLEFADSSGQQPRVIVR
ncbi:MAG: heparinase II/III family protein [Acidobacteriota bacterium]|nr:MAG: heparinase II/III family protein [Acidobacteriota bacterium]